MNEEMKSHKMSGQTMAHDSANEEEPSLRERGAEAYGHAEQAVSDAYAKAADVYGHAEQAVSDAYGKAAEAVSGTLEQAKTMSRKHPGATLLAAFGIGVGIGLILRPQMQRSRSNRYARPVVGALAEIAMEFFR